MNPLTPASLVAILPHLGSGWLKPSPLGIAFLGCEKWVMLSSSMPGFRGFDRGMYLQKWMNEVRLLPPKNCRKAGAGVCIGYRVYCHLIHYHKFSPNKTFHATLSVFSIFFVSCLFIMYLLYPKLFALPYPLIYAYV